MQKQVTINQRQGPYPLKGHPCTWALYPQPSNLLCTDLLIPSSLSHIFNHRFSLLSAYQHVPSSCAKHSKTNQTHAPSTSIEHLFLVFLPSLFSYWLLSRGHRRLPAQRVASSAGGCDSAPASGNISWFPTSHRGFPTERP